MGPLPLNYSTAGIEELVEPGDIPFAKFPTSISASGWTEAAVGPVSQAVLLCCAVLCCAVLCCAVLCRAVMCCVGLGWAGLGWAGLG